MPTTFLQRLYFILWNLVDDSTHVAHGAVAEKRHRAVGDAPPRLDFRPPDAAMTQASAAQRPTTAATPARAPARRANRRR